MLTVPELLNELSALERERQKVLWPLVRELETLRDQERDINARTVWYPTDEEKENRRAIGHEVAEKAKAYAMRWKEFAQREKSLRQRISGAVLAAGETQHGDDLDAVYVGPHIVIRQRKEKQL